MPEIYFHVRWPDGATEVCYSPSLVVKDHLLIGKAYTVPDFLRRSRAALTIASERVREKYGMPCSRALGQLARIEATAGRFSAGPDSLVTVTAFED